MSQSNASLYCQQLAEMLAECDSGDPDEQAVERVEKHIEQCPICQSAESVLSASLIQLQQNHESDELSPSFEARLVDLLCHRDDVERSSER